MSNTVLAARLNGNMSVATRVSQTIVTAPHSPSMRYWRRRFLGAFSEAWAAGLVAMSDAAGCRPGVRCIIRRISGVESRT